MKNRFRHILSKPYILLFLAVFLFGLSLLFNSEYTQRSSVSRERYKLESYIHNEEENFRSLVADTSLMNKLSLRKESLSEFHRIEKSKSGLFIYRFAPFEVKELLFWSDQMVIPPDVLDTLPDGEYYQELSNGIYLSLKKTLDSNLTDTIVAYYMIPISFRYFLSTNLLQDHFAYSENAHKKVDITDEFTEYPVKNIDGSLLFYLREREHSPVTTANKPVVWLRIAAMLLLLLFIHTMAVQVGRRWSAWAGIVFLFVTVVLLRVISYYYPIPVNFRQFDVFDPSIYGSNPVQKSLGDLFINASLFCWIVLFAWAKIDKGEIRLFTSNTRKPYWTGVLASLVLVVTTFIIAYIIRSLVADSNISFDVMNFFSLTKFSVIGFIVLAIITISFYYFARILIQYIKAVFQGNFHWVYFIIAFAGLAYLTFIYINPQTAFFLFVLGWLLLFTWLMIQSRFTINRIRVNVTSALFWMFVFSVSITAVIIGANREKEWEIRKRLAVKLHNQYDPNNETNLNTTLVYIDDDFLEDNFYRFADKEQGSLIRDSILRKQGMSRFDTRIYVFDSSGRGINNDDPESYNTLNTIQMMQSKPTTKEHLFYFETAFDKFTFIFKREHRDASGQLKGTVFVVSNPKEYTRDALYAEIFKQPDQSSPEESPLYSTAVYRNKKLVSPLNNYSFPTSLTASDIPYEEYKKKINGDFDELWYKASGEKVVVIAKKRDSVIEAITLFSYIFCVFLFLVTIIGIVILFVRVSQQRSRLGQAFQMNIRTQVHTTIIFISLLSFLVIGVATISFFISRYKRNNEEKLSGTLEVMVNETQKRMKEFSTFDDVIAIHDTVTNQELLKLVNDVADVHDVDVNVYDTSGHLKVSSQPIIYREGYLSTRMHPRAFYYLNRLRRGQHIQQEQMPTLSYLSIYGSVRNEDGDVEAYLNIPYFLSQRELNQEISNFLVTIINLNAFIFLIAGIIALFITNRITNSFSLISEKMKAINLGRNNEEITWNRDDEIGELVAEYNKMVGKLGESANALAQSEREGAWREMARQVAHEIKNPLTPMKLSIQYLQKSINNNSANVKELTGHVAKTLVEQIDHLSKIAADFSQFANIGNTNPETFDLHEVIYSLRDLYRANAEVNIDLNTLPAPVMVRTDKTQMNRLFTNLLQNAIEACSGEEKCSIILNETRYDGKVRVAITDNGHGIPEDMHSRIFVPNFTTKSSGTGLGLAMVKGIIEQAGGDIWFETGVDRGTTFFVELPTVN